MRTFRALVVLFDEKAAVRQALAEKAIRLIFRVSGETGSPRPSN